MQVLDFSTAIQQIRAANSDCTALVEIWKDLLTSATSVSLLFSDGSTVTMDSIATAIKKYLGGQFTSIILTNGTYSVTLQVNSSGALVLTDANNILAPMVVGALQTSAITGNPTMDSVNLQDSCIISNATIGKAAIADSTITKTTIGSATVTDNLTIEGSLAVDSIAATSTTAEQLIYSSQILNFGNTVNMYVGQTSYTATSIVLTNTGSYWAKTSTWDPSILGFQLGTSAFVDRYTYQSTVVPNAVTARVAVAYQDDNGAVSPAITNPDASQSNLEYISQYLGWPVRTYSSEVEYYSLQLQSLATYSGRVFYVQTLGNPVTIDRMLTVTYYGSSTITEAAVSLDYVIPKYTCCRFMVEFTDERTSGAGQTITVLEPM